MSSGNLPAPSRLMTLFLALGCLLMTGWLLVLGRDVILPVLTAVLVVYIMVACVRWMRGRPGLGWLPDWILHVVVLGVFVVLITSLGSVVALALEQLVDRAPAYQQNLAGLVAQVAAAVGAEADTSLQDLWQDVAGQIDLAELARGLLASVAAFGGTLFIVVVYAGFLLGEWTRFPRKVAAAFPGDGQAARIGQIAGEINRKVGRYLAVKTGVNVVLGCLSYAVLWSFEVDFAPFWAIVIGLLNYIPYVGSYIGVTLPVLLSVAQFGSLLQTLALAAALTVMQVFVGNYLEPRWIGRELNLSPFMVILSLSVWSALWGVPGAILAVPMTSVLVIVLAAFDGTRPFAVLVADVPAETARQADRARR